MLSAAAAPWAAAVDAAENPLGKVIQLMDDLSAKVVAEGEAAAKAFGEYKEWCDEAPAGRLGRFRAHLPLIVWAARRSLGRGRGAARSA